MPANLEIQSDAEVPITAWNFGGIQGGNFNQQKFFCENTGSDEATDVQIIARRLVQNDGIDFIDIALDVSGNPGAYGDGPLNIGVLAAGDQIAFWVRSLVPPGTTPQGNMRQFEYGALYNGT